jgi:hypothetical protein
MPAHRYHRKHVGQPVDTVAGAERDIAIQPDLNTTIRYQHRVHIASGRAHSGQEHSGYTTVLVDYVACLDDSDIMALVPDDSPFFRELDDGVVREEACHACYEGTATVQLVFHGDWHSIAIPVKGSAMEGVHGNGWRGKERIDEAKG